MILQVFSFRLFGRRIFRIAPFHHHFEFGGWPETTVIDSLLDPRGAAGDARTGHLLRRLS